MFRIVDRTGSGDEVIVFMIKKLASQPATYAIQIMVVASNFRQTHILAH